MLSLSLYTMYVKAVKTTSSMNKLFSSETNGHTFYLAPFFERKERETERQRDRDTENIIAINAVASFYIFISQKYIYL